jgi:hypothetical protein
VALTELFGIVVLNKRVACTVKLVLTGIWLIKFAAGIDTLAA